jgi:hypothetical protein
MARFKMVNGTVMPMDPEEEAELDATRSLNALKLQRATSLGHDVRMYTENRYPPHKQRTLSHYRGLPTTSQASKDAIDSAWAWLNSVLVYYYQKEDEVVAAADETALYAIAWDMSPFDATDPNVTIRATLGL